MVVTKFLPFLFVVIFLAAVLGMTLYYRCVSLLRESHPEKWKELGRPTLFGNNSIKTNLQMLTFLKNKEYLNLEDPKLIFNARLLWNYGVAYLIFFMVVLFIFAIKS